MVTNWSPNGVAEFRPATLNPETVQQLFTHLESFQITWFDKENLLAELKEAIGRYNSDRQIKDRSKPAEAKGRLRDALKQAENLQRSLEQLDGNSYSLINSELQQVSSEELRAQYLEDFIAATQKALKKTENWPSGGRLPDDAKKALGHDLLRIFETHTNSKAKPTQGNGFEGFFQIIMAEATGNPENSPHNFIRELVRERDKQSHCFPKPNSLHTNEPN